MAKTKSSKTNKARKQSSRMIVIDEQWVERRDNKKKLLKWFNKTFAERLKAS